MAIHPLSVLDLRWVAIPVRQSCGVVMVPPWLLPFPARNRLFTQIPAGRTHRCFRARLLISEWFLAIAPLVLW